MPSRTPRAPKQTDAERSTAFAAAWLTLARTGAWHYPDGSKYGPYPHGAQRANIAHSWAEDARHHGEDDLAERLEALAQTIEQGSHTDAMEA